MDKGKAVKIGLAVIFLVAAIVLIARTLMSGGSGTTTQPALTSAPTSILVSDLLA